MYKTYVQIKKKYINIIDQISINKDTNYIIITN